MKKKLDKLIGILICITFTVFLLFLKDKMDVIWGAVRNLFTILTPFIYGFAIAYIMNFPYRFFRTKVFGKVQGKMQKVVKPLSIVISYVLVIGIISGLVAFLVPQLVNNVNILLENITSYIENLGMNIDNFVAWINENLHISATNLSSIYKYIISFINVDNIKNAGEAIIPVITNTAVIIYNWVLGIIISIYFLSSKEFLFVQLKRFSAAFLPTKWMPTIYRIINVTDNKCGKFFVGKAVDSGIIGLLCLISMSLLNIPYAALISVIVAVTNIIPFFGPFIGAIPSALLLLMVSPWDALKFIILIIIIQQLDGNVIGPKVVGSQVGLTSFWSLFSVIVAGGLFGVVGMVLGTPIFATIYTLLGDKVSHRIKMKGKNAYRVINMPVINNENLTNIKAKKTKKDSKSKESTVEEMNKS